MIVPHILFNTAAICSIGVFGLMGHSNGLSLELYYLLTNGLAGLFALFLGSVLFSYAEFGQNLDVMLPLFVFVIAIPSNTLLKSLLIPRHAINRLDNNKPSFYTFGAIVGSMRGLWFCTLMVASISVTNNLSLTEKVHNSIAYDLFAPFAKPLHTLTPYFYKDKLPSADVAAAANPTEDQHKKLGQAEVSCPNELKSLRGELSKVSDIEQAKLNVYSRMLSDIDCDGVDALKRKFLYLQSLSGFKGRVVGYIITRELSFSCAKHDCNLDEEVTKLMAEDALSYLQSFTSDGVMYHSFVKPKKEGPHQAHQAHQAHQSGGKNSGGSSINNSMGDNSFGNKQRVDQDLSLANNEDAAGR